MIGFIQNAIEDSSFDDETHFIFCSNCKAQGIMTRGMLTYSFILNISPFSLLQSLLVFFSITEKNN